jgi:flagellar basal-body rod modification protein FlgD
MSIAPAAATTNVATSASTAAAVASNVASPTIAQNFTTFLQLLTTQLKNQNPLDPLDTNQFTQQLVQFAQVEQQMNMNQSLTALIALQNANQASQALGFIGATAVVNGDTAQLTGGKATWQFSADRPATATINVMDSSGAVVYAQTGTITAGPQVFSWDGHDSTGQPMPDGKYTISVTAKDATGQTVSIATEVQGVVDGVDVSQSPPALIIGGRTFTLDKVKEILRPGA